MVKRELYMDKIISFIDKDFIKIITGIRRCGKSYLLNQIIEYLINNGVNKENILLLDLELPRYNNISTREELDNIVLNFLNSHNGKVYLFFDEIQKVKDWEISINGFYKLKNTDVYVTGSNSNIISDNLATLLTGRFVNINLYPFSFNEFLDYKKELNAEPLYNNDRITLLENLFREYINYGGMPLTISSVKKNITLNDLFSSILYNDIVKKYNIRDFALFERILKFLVENIGNIVSGNSIFKFLKHEFRISKPTIYNYLKYAENSYLFSKVTQENLISKKEIVGGEKYYLMDTGFYTSQLEGKQINLGKILENIVYLELLRHDYKITIGNNNNKSEVDFVCRKDNIKLYIQVAYLLSDDKTISREFKPLYEIKDNYPKYVISMDSFDFSRDGIIHLNLIDFLTGSIL